MEQKFGLTSPQFLVLEQLKNESTASITKISKNIHLSPATVGSIIERLEQKNLIRRTPSNEDKRIVFVQLTQEGQELSQKIPPLLPIEFSKALEKMEPWEQNLLLSNLQRLATMIEEKTPLKVLN